MADRKLPGTVEEMSVPTKRQLASRANARMGGPKTEEGKSVTRMNATQHGILSRFKTPYDPVDLDEIHARLVEEFGADTLSRHVMVQMLALTIVRLSRCARAETEILTEALNRNDRGGRATLDRLALMHLGVIYERYEPRLVSRMIKLIEALNNGPS